jgi:ribosomal protein S6--L-glutamate ligase
MIRIGVAGVAGAWSSERIRDALRVRGADVLLFESGACTLDLDAGRVWHDGQDLSVLDGVVVKKLGDSTDPLTPGRVHLLRYLEFRGVRVFSRADAIGEVNDRYRMTVRLSQAGIPMPRTLITESLDEAAAAVEEWGRAVLKPLFTSKGRGMVLLAHGGAYRLALRRWRKAWPSPFYIQEFVPHDGRDIGVTVLGRQVLGAYYRVGRADTWLTTTRAGGRYAPCPLDRELETLALMAAHTFGLDFTGVDLVRSPHGYLVYEVSAFGGFAGLWHANGTDAADWYARYILQFLGRGDGDRAPAAAAGPPN